MQGVNWAGVLKSRDWAAVVGGVAGEKAERGAETEAVGGMDLVGGGLGMGDRGRDDGCDVSWGEINNIILDKKNTHNLTHAFLCALKGKCFM